MDVVGGEEPVDFWAKVKLIIVKILWPSSINCDSLTAFLYGKRVVNAPWKLPSELSSQVVIK